ncbi:MAG TPA: polyphosphate kinase 2 [Candidatus Krumholzibacteria bacterium]|nr:polyphosphate kinase 2 [Candidatus Krumholzibacteria bacterium]HPD70422.1 polyphosphate kinase 2 [Candidatus Krumholzibacteria bacterium]HRY39878.1 polyphosphate kinase 2 [Candidatus Krumholzibacteria bacterium]
MAKRSRDERRRPPRGGGDNATAGAGASAGRAGRAPELKRKTYLAVLRRLHEDLVALQGWVTATGYRAVVVFEGRDAAGKGGVIKAITERVSPRVFRTVALPAPSEREKTQLYLQRYVTHFPAAGEVVLFDRSWYNRAGVEKVMGFCNQDEYESFLQFAPIFERAVVRSGIHLVKYWFEVGMAEQQRRFEDRIEDPRKLWKLSAIDLASYHRWYEYSRVRDAMFAATDTDDAPWYVVPADDQRRARLNCIAHLLSLIPYEKVDRQPIVLGERRFEGRYDDVESLAGRRHVPDRY